MCIGGFRGWKIEERHCKVDIYEIIYARIY